MRAAKAQTAQSRQSLHCLYLERRDRDEYTSLAQLIAVHACFKDDFTHVRKVHKSPELTTGFEGKDQELI